MNEATINELANVNEGSFAPSVHVVANEDGTFRKEYRYHEFSTFNPETAEEKIILFKVFNEPDSATPMKQCVGKEFGIKNFKFTPYESLDEETGVLKSGVTTVIETDDGSFIATASKSVYYSVIKIMGNFGLPTDENYKVPIVKVTSKKVNGNDSINISLVGFEK